MLWNLSEGILRRHRITIRVMAGDAYRGLGSSRTIALNTSTLELPPKAG
jgi:hypothetical protein